MEIKNTTIVIKKSGSIFAGNNLYGRDLREKKKAFLDSLVNLKRRISVTPEPGSDDCNRVINKK